VNPRLILVDADIVAYRAAVTAEEESFGIAYARAKETLELIARNMNCADMRLFLSGEPEHNFRKVIYPEYKANRKQERPKWLEDIKERMVLEMDAVVMDGCEADDGMSMEQTGETVIASIDKDLLQIPGYHWNWVTEKYTYIEVPESMYNFYRHVLIGDSADNIKGCPKIGPVKAERILAGCTSEQEMFDAVRETYNDDASFLLNGQLIWLWRKENDIWNPPELKQEAGMMSESTTTMSHTQRDQSMEPTGEKTEKVSQVG